MGKIGYTEINENEKKNKDYLHGDLPYLDRNSPTEFTLVF